jgi:hypothetical protein
MNKQTQCARLERLLRRKSGVTSLEIIQHCGTVAPHRRLADLKERGWKITRKQVVGKSYGRYFGVQPAKAKSL